VIAAIAIVVIVGTAAAGPAGAVKTFTGCLVTGDGVIIKVKEGDSPKSACTSGQTLARLSGGDITKISVTGGLTLTNGGESGDVEINLDAKYSLPQGCADGRIAEWDTGPDPDRWICGVDSDTTYTAGTGLDLSNANQFSIESGYRIPGKSCTTAGEFSKGFDSNGAIECAAPGTSSLTSLSAAQGNFASGDGVPDDDSRHTYVNLSQPAGRYLLIGKGVLLRGDDDIGFQESTGAFGCGLSIGGTTLDQTRFRARDNEDDESYGFSLTSLATTQAGDLILWCDAEDDADLVSVRNARVVAVPAS
jgi:hypothetical protein